jgi:acyl-CoA synthetase (AMP-forming)/AMP-acid ligase II/acyl carrier protein
MSTTQEPIDALPGAGASRLGNASVPTTLHGILSERARVVGARRAYTFEGSQGDSQISFAQLERRAHAIAAALAEVVSPGDRVALLFPAGLDFITAFFGCLYAGVRAVPTTYPKPRRPMPRLISIAKDCGARAALTDSETLWTIDRSIALSELPEMQWLAVDQIPDGSAECYQPVDVAPDEIAFLQYTSGSTSDPKGVMVTHANLLHNLEMIRQGFGLHPFSAESKIHTGAFWLPAYHDMGLIGGILESMFVGGHSVLMSPAAFLQRPLGWLEAMSRHTAAVSGAPNFAYELCVSRSTEEQRRRLDLSNWRVAFCGAEPIRAETLERFAAAFAPAGFREEAFYPCYGLAEGTLLAAGGDGPGRPRLQLVSRDALARHRVEFVRASANGDPDSVQKLVACGGPRLGQKIKIVDAETREECTVNQVGEIWLHGPSVALGYWNRQEESDATFRARLAGSAEGPYLRTGDLGFMIADQLVVTGRVKDVIIIRGRNHYPQDVERTVGDAHEALRPDAGAVFTVERDGLEQVVVVHEVDRQYRKADFDEVIRSVRRGVSMMHELEVYAIVLIRHASLPRTTSGKAQRHLCRQQFEAGELNVLAEWRRVERPEAEAATTVPPMPLPDAPAATGAQSDRTAPQRLARAEQPMSPDEIDRLAERVESWLLNWLVDRAAFPESEVNRDKPFAEYGLDSLTAVELSQELEDWLGVDVVPTVAWNYPTPATLSRYLAREAGGANRADELEAAVAPMDDQFSCLLAEIEALTDAEAQRLLDSDGKADADGPESPLG